MNEFKRLCISFALIGISTCNHADSSPNIAIDVGHSRLSPGAISARGKPEFEFNADLAKSLQSVLDSHNIMSFFIGEDGDMVDINQRTAKANANNASLLLSIHHDSAQPQYLNKWTWRHKTLSYGDNFSGFSLFISRKNPQLEKSLDCARMIGKALKRNGFTSSNHHAQPINGENRQWADKSAGVYYYDDLIVLKTAKMPAVLLEAGVIINRNEEQDLQTDSTRNLIASAITEGIEHCFGLK